MVMSDVAECKPERFFLTLKARNIRRKWIGWCRKGRNKPLSLTFGLGGNSYGCVIFRPDRIGAEYPNLVAVEDTKSQYELCSVILSVCVKFVTLHEFIREKTHE